MSDIELSRIGLVSADPKQLAQFYMDAFGFCLEEQRSTEMRLKLHHQNIEIMAFDLPGRSYPDHITGENLLFQHFAIVVADMRKAYERLKSQPGWSPISLAGPEQLPMASGGVSAFKFRDPEGHPLEFIAFPDNSQPSIWRTTPGDSLYLGIDHSAISVADTERSIAFYQALGFVVSGCSLNRGSEQGRLDAVPSATVNVTGLELYGQAAPHLELLCYRGEGAQRDQKFRVPDPNDIAATRLVFRVHTAAAFSRFCALFKDALLAVPEMSDGHVLRVLLRDPDNHLIALELVQPPVAKPG